MKAISPHRTMPLQPTGEVHGECRQKQKWENYLAGANGHCQARMAFSGTRLEELTAIASSFLVRVSMKGPRSATLATATIGVLLRTTTTCTTVVRVARTTFTSITVITPSSAEASVTTVSRCAQFQNKSRDVIAWRLASDLVGTRLVI